MKLSLAPVDNAYRERVLRARRSSPEEKLLARGEIFDRVCAWMKAGIQAELPNAEEVQVRQILRERLLLARRLENARWTDDSQ